MNLHDVNKAVKAKPKRFRAARGQGSGNGMTAGRGTKGARARSGWRYKLFREGGQMPIARRLPKRGFNNANFSLEWSFVNLRDLNAFADGETVNIATCTAKGLIPYLRDGLKVLGHGTLERKLTIQAHRVSASARKAIEEKGGKVELLKAPGEDTAKNWKAHRGEGKSMKRRKRAKERAAALKAKGAPKK